MARRVIASPSTFPPAAPSTAASRGRQGREQAGRRVTIEVTIGLSGRAEGLDQAPVDVGFAVERRPGALTVPVKALLARQGGGYAVELASGGGMVSRLRPGCTPTTSSRSRAIPYVPGATVVTAR